MTTRLTSRPRSLRGDGFVGVIVATLFWAVATAVVIPALRTPPYVERITVDNPHPWNVHVEATGGDRTGWVAVGGVTRDQERTVADVLDQGDTWILRFAYGGQVAETRLSRDQLTRDGWHVTVPDELADRLRAAGIPESPR